MSTEWSQYSPWYVRTLIGISAWLAAILFLVFLFGMDILDSAGMTALLGIIFLIATTLIELSSRTPLPSRSREDAAGVRL